MPVNLPGDPGLEPGALYVVATPIGNLGDLSPRAQAVLGAVSRIAAEDTRTTSALLAHFGIRTPPGGLVALHDHNETRIAEGLIAELADGATLAVVSDAGTPLISDPGYALVRAARAAGRAVYTVPGPCAAIAALSVSGLPTDRFVFAGFLPAKSGARRAAFERIKAEPRTVIYYESTHRIEDSLDDLVAVLGSERRVCLARELTKRFEQSITLPAAELRTWQREDPNRGRGEFVLIVEGAPEAENDDRVDAEAERVLRLLLAELPASRAVRLAVEITGAARKPLYQLALKLAGDSDRDDNESA
ncbi:16S rRNA (cytidine(1402)-2'-O)-methyltransferase [Nevskia ramosa]|uniref:16S rRNA (cytidine(1402)-2'-O)-methyltransferase n=1 Tax=Nevskia ramosa TaxID=64002 RepID=UPI003D0A33E4